MVSFRRKLRYIHGKFTIRQCDKIFFTNKIRVGTYYFGKIHSDPVTGFAFTALTAGGHEFDDSREPLHRQEAIIKAIKTSEAEITV